MRLKDKVAIITGASNGMGAEEARLFAKHGAKVVIADLLQEDAEAVKADITNNGGEAIFIHTDVTSEASWQNLIQQTLSRWGKLDILINNAGINISGSDNPDLQGWNRIMEVNATGVFLGTKHAIEPMRQNGGGSIVNISSIAGFVGSEDGHPAYYASKGAVRIFTKAMAVKHGPHGIRVNSVHPGLLPPMRTANPDTTRRDQYIRQTPLRRTGERIEVAYGVLFLASDEASFITGTELVIDGGFIAV